MTTTAREIHLAARPQGWPTPADFRTVDVELADPGPGEVLVRNTSMSVDPYMRGRMNDVKSYVPPFALDAVMDGGAVGEVIASGADGLEVGDTVLHQAGWRTHALLSAKAVRKVDVSQVPASAYLGALGMPGMTAYVGLTRIAPVEEGDTVFISGAAGAVGSAAGQIAKQLGAAKVIGSAGSAEKCEWLTELGFDVALNYKDAPIGRQLREHGPVNVYFDNVGGEHLEAAIFAMADHGRIAECGMIADYNADGAPAGPRNMMMLISKRLTLRGFIVTDHGDATSEFYRRAGAWVADGSLTWRETVVDGIDNAVDAFLGLHRGDNTGKMLVRL
ncbi:NADP-dependent oxidoreductase [Nocardioides sp. Root1257]|uniref:NADP-dependent oxidoreductase n=1 Tax=unclassified Nocardioides TaxID=2615069 RepID=UPI0006FC65B9|nr:MULTISPECIES: NADP-dependent oxidoreductase [unclassified Nocardioides]KQW52960.1 NADP-dependent oxidoreductase [Nocardioides sp. Root1257]KRC55648.1 NADP-dependent oxidoreductase [Nocardioides sp. Root224]